MKSVSKAIIPAAGYGTRHLPITKALPKELLPILDRPSVDYVVEECVSSGITDICIVLSRGKGAVEDYFDRHPEIEANLAASGKRDLLKKVNPYLGKVNITYIRQPEMKGTAYAIGMCRDFTAGEAFAVLFPGDLFFVRRGRVFRFYPGHAHGLELKIGHRTGRVLRKGVVDTYAYALTASERPIHEMLRQ